MEGIGVVLFIIMIVFSLLEQASKAKQKPGQRPPQRMPPRRRPGLELPPTHSDGPLEDREAGNARAPMTLPDAQGARDRSAADMVAEDFWRELTGMPPRPQPAPPPAPAPAEASSWDEEALRHVEAPPPETAPRRESKSWDYRRPDVVHEPPVVVSLEEPLPTPDVRHAAYHKRLAAQDAALAKTATRARVAAAQTASEASSPLLRRLRRGEGLRESVIMAEVFGRPRGLEEHSPDR